MKWELNLVKLNRFFIFLFLSACISIYEPEIRELIPRVVIDGTITDLPGPYEVRIYSTASSSNVRFFPNVFPEVDEVSISDDEGNVAILQPTGNGFFKTNPDDIQGVPGRTYTLYVRLADGTEITSVPETLPNVPEIEDLTVEYEQLPVGSAFRGHFRVYINFQDTPIIGDNYRWKWTHFKRKEYCNIAMRTVQRCCVPCWDMEVCSRCINIASDRFFNGQRIQQHLLNVPYNSQEPYYLLVELQSISAAAYNFWRMVDNQVNKVGSIFDNTPAPIPGNLINLKDPDDEVLGLFSAMGFRKRVFYIQRDNIPELPFDLIQPDFFILPACVACPETFTTTSIRPLGWID